MSHRVEQVAGRILEEVSSIIRYELADPRIGLLSVTTVKVSPDLQSATILVSLEDAEDEDEARATMKALARAERFIRRELAQRLDLRHVPTVQFRRDVGAEHARRVSEILDHLDIPPAPPEEGEARPSTSSD